MQYRNVLITDITYNIMPKHVAMMHNIGNMCIVM